MLGRWLTVPDTLPRTKADAVYCPTYGPTRDGKQLTILSKLCMIWGIAAVAEGQAKRLIVSVALQGKEFDFPLRMNVLEKAGLPEGTVHLLPDITDTFDEVAKCIVVLRSINARSVIVIAERYHMRRTLRVFRILAPDLVLYSESFTPPYYECAYHPVPIRSISQGNKFLWMVWNAVFILAVPFLIKKETQR